MKQLTAKDVMIPDVLTASKNWSVDYLLNFLLEHSITGAPVITDDGKLEGVVSLTDIARTYNLMESVERENEPHDFYLQEAREMYRNEIRESIDVKDEDRTLVQDIMTPMVFSVTLDTSLSQIADFMIRGRIHRVLVTENKKLAGIITTIDMLKIIKEYAQDDG